MTRVPPRNPLIAIVGATGTGKSQLAVEIAKRHNGEIINGDAMQLYAGLPIITNKISVQEQEGIPHHLLGCIGLDEQPWVVGTFVRKALSTIEEIRSRGKVPILVGGTHYYTQSLLFHDRLAGKEDVADVDLDLNPSEKWPMLDQPIEVLLEELKKIDPVMADRWHPNDRRKIQRSLEIFLQTGRKASDIYAEQRRRIHPAFEHSNNEARQDTGEPKMRFPTLLLWVHAEPDILRQRLDDRVDMMLDQGLLQEVEELNKFAQTQAIADQPVDESRGIWVCIGYKEFKPYIEAHHATEAMEKRLKQLRLESLEHMKAATRQYSKRQLRWIRIKLVHALSDAGASENLYLLDGSDKEAFEETVVAPGVDLAAQFRRGENMPPPNSLSSIATEMLVPKRDYDLSAAPEKWSKQHCEICNVTCVTPDQWQQHVKSKAHRKLVSKSKQTVDRIHPKEWTQDYDFRT